MFHAVADPRDGTILAASNSWAYGGTVHRSGDGGATWERSEKIELPERELGEVWALLEDERRFLA